MSASSTVFWGGSADSAYCGPLDDWLAHQCGATCAADLPRKIREAQAERLRRTLRHAAEHSVFYAAHLHGRDFEPATVEGIASLPFTTAEDLRRWEDFLCVSRGDVERMVTLQTSGTTGQPKRLAFTENDIARTREFFAVGMRQLVGPGQRLAVLLPGAERPDGVADLLRQALEASGIEVASPPPAMLRGQYAELARWLTCWRPCCMVAAPAQLAALLPHFADRPPGLAGVLASAEPLGPDLRNALTAQWRCEVLDHYGLTETAYGGAVECRAHNGLHVRELDVLVEIVDISGSKVLNPGQVGEIVVTTLGREAMPLVRYRTGDAASLLPGPCACGSPLQRLGPVLGRIERGGSGGRARIIQPPKGQARQEMPQSGGK